MFEYKGYHAEVVYNEETNYWTGWLYGISDFVTFGGETEAEVENDFYEAVDEYLDYCKEIRKEPKREVSDNLDVRVNSDLYKSLKLAAQNAGESFNSFVEKILTDYLAKTA